MAEHTLALLNDTQRRLAWVAGIALANAAAAAIASSRVLRDATGEGWIGIVPSASVATLGLTLGGLWWGTRRQPRLRTGLGIGLLVGVFVHPVTWYLAVLWAYFRGVPGGFGDSTLTPWEGLGAIWVYSFFSLLFTGWLSLPISAAICGAGLALYARYARRPAVPAPQAEPPIVCYSCGADWSRGAFSEDCRECGGGALDRACPWCDGTCGQRWRRAIVDSHDEKEAHWVGNCARLPQHR